MPNDSRVHHRHLVLPALALASLGVLIGRGAAVSAQRAVPRTIVLQVHRCADIPSAVIARARTEVLRLFDRIGVTARWEGCGLEPALHARTADALQIPVLLWTREAAVQRQTIHADVLGVVVRTDDGALDPPSVWVFYRRVERAAHAVGIDPSLLLGHVVAHEAGHVLLPPAGGHGPYGVMRGAWSSADLLALAQGGLVFSADQAVLIRERLRDGTLSVAAAAMADDHLPPP